jgi:hypothetical protein
MRRRTDRLETVVFAVLLLVVCVAAPLLAVAASGWENSVSLRELHAQRTTLRRVEATLLDHAQDTGAYPVMAPEADVRWTGPGGQRVTGRIGVAEGAEAGSVIWIWTDPAGQPVMPLRRHDISTRDALAASAAAAGVCVLGVAAGLVICITLNRRRLTAWGIDWMRTEPRWNTRR